MAAVNQKLLEKSITDALSLQRLTANERKKITELLVKLASTLRGKFAELPELSSMSETKRRKLIDKYAKDCDKEISAQFASFGKTYTKTLAGIAVFEAARAAKNINTTLEVSLLPEKVLTAEQAQTLISESWVSGKTVSEMLSNSEESFRSAFKEQIRQGYAAGETNDQIIRRIKGYTDKSGLKHNGIAEMSRKSAETMVRTAVMGVANDARWKLYESNSDILQGVMWVATLDERTCPECRARDGKMWDMNRQPVGGHEFPFEYPPSHRNCVTGDTLVSSCGRISAVSKRWIEGEVVLIKTASGNNLTCTPNHPILTLNGWVAACEVDKVGNVISNSISKRRRFANRNVKNMPAVIEEVVSAFLRSGSVFTIPVPLTSEDFHGDGRNGDVAIIGSDLFLRTTGKPAFGKHLNQSKFSLGLSRFVMFAGASSFGKFFRASYSTACRNMRFFKKCVFSLWRGVIHACLLLFRSVTNMYANFFKSFTNCGAATSKLLRNSTKANSVGIHLNSAVNIKSLEINTIDNVHSVIMQNGRDGLVINTKFSSNFANGVPILIGDDDLGFVKLFTTANSKTILAGIFENISHSAEAGRELTAQFADGSSLDVFVDEVVSVERRKFCGHVYNLQTGSGIYVANNIITHNCRCTLSPVLKRYGDIKGRKDLAKASPSTRASMDGQVPNSMTFEDWFAQQSDTRQREILGAGRYELYKSGKISFGDLVDQNGRGLTLEEIKSQL